MCAARAPAYEPCKIHVKTREGDERGGMGTCPIVDPRRAWCGQVLVDAGELDVSEEVGGIGGGLGVVEPSERVGGEIRDGDRVACRYFVDIHVGPRNAEGDVP